MTEKEFIQNIVEEYHKIKLKKFPDDFIENIECKVIHIPNKILIIGENFFDNYVISTVDGNIVYAASTYEEAKYIVYASRNKVDKVLIPKDFEKMKLVLVDYEKYIDSIIYKISSEYNVQFPKQDNLNNIVNDVMRILNLVRY